MLQIAMSQHRHHEVLAAVRDASPGDQLVAHDWMQRHFPGAPPDVQRDYVDVVVSMIRRDRAPLWRQQAWMAWMLGLTQHQFETRQIADFYAACSAMRRVGCLRRVWAAVPSLRSWIDD